MTQTLNFLISPIIIIMILHNSWRSGANGVFYGVYSYTYGLRDPDNSCNASCCTLGCRWT